MNSICQKWWQDMGCCQNKYHFFIWSVACSSITKRSLVPWVFMRLECWMLSLIGKMIFTTLLHQMKWKRWSTQNISGLQSTADKPPSHLWLHSSQSSSPKNAQNQRGHFSRWSFSIVGIDLQPNGHNWIIIYTHSISRFFAVSCRCNILRGVELVCNNCSLYELNITS